MRFELSTLNAGRRASRHARCWFALVALGWPQVPARCAAESLAAEGWKPVVVRGAQLPCLAGMAENALIAVSCQENCAPIPFQLDERDPEDRLVLDAGPQAGADRGGPGLDANDEIVVMAGDLGRRARPEELPGTRLCGHAVHVRGVAADGWFYVLAAGVPAPRSPLRYVAYDPAADVMTGRRVAIGFGAATPRSLRLRDPAGTLGTDLLDRLKVRASARFFGILPLGRDEDDIESRYVAWRSGAVRVIRREEKWVRLGFGLRTPIFRSDTTFYRDYVELPVQLRLNFPPAHFFSAIEVRALLDFVDLRGWRLHVPGALSGFVAGGMTTDERARLESLEVDSVALVGLEVALVLALDLGTSLSPLRRRLVYREDRRWHSPEDTRGELPGIGFRLTDWDAIQGGHHAFTATSYALPADYDLERFARERRQTWSIETAPVPSHLDRDQLTPAARMK